MSCRPSRLRVTAGVPVTLVDTAGLRETADVIEIEGVERARQAQRVAGLTLAVVDGGSPLSREDRRFVDGLTAAPHIIVIAKVDLPRAFAPAELAGSAPMVEVSALTGHGLERLRAKIVESLTGREELRDPPRISNARHLALVDDALSSLGRGVEALAEGATEELVLADLGAARQALEEITGRRTPEDLLRHIFSRFCIGK